MDPSFGNWDPKIFYAHFAIEQLNRSELINFAFFLAYHQHLTLTEVNFDVRHIFIQVERSNFIFWAFSSSSCRHKIVLSAYCQTATPFGMYSGTKPIVRLLNRKGDISSPCLTPLQLLKKTILSHLPSH